jgi:symplekin
LIGPNELTDVERNALMRGSVGRIWDGAEELKVDSVVPSQWPGSSPTDMWMLLIVRMVTRVAHLDGDQQPASEDEGDAETKVDFYSRQDNLRQTLCDYVMADFPSRYVLDLASYHKFIY